MEPQGLSSIAGGMQTGTATLEDSLAVSYKTKHAINIGLAVVLLSGYPNNGP